MNYGEITANILNKFGIDERYKGFKYIISSITFINKYGTDVLPVTKFLYSDVGKLYCTSRECVERNIRKTIEIIWNKSDNFMLISEIFGQENAHKKLSNFNFLLSLYKYISAYDNKDLLYNHLKNNHKFTCPMSGMTCEFSDEFLKELICKIYL